MSWSLNIGKAAGTGVRLHITFVLFLAWVFVSNYASSGAATAWNSLLFMVLLFLYVLLHEFGHIFTAQAFGVPTPYVTLLPIGGVAQLERIPEEPREEFLIAIAGPAVNVVIAGATVMGSWSFIIVQSAILFVWIAANLVGAMRGSAPYPFILLNLALSFQAAYAAPIIMMSQNRQQDIDRKAAENDYRINVKAELELLHEKIDQLREREVLKLTEAVRMLTELLEQSASGARESDAESERPS